MPLRSIISDAWTSLSCTCPHCGQTHDLSRKLKLSFLYPQSHSFEEGNHLSILCTVQPYLDATWTRILQKLPWQRSLILRPHSLLIPLRFKSSMNMVSYLRHNSWANFHWKSARLLDMLSYCLHKESLACSLWLEPLTQRECFFENGNPAIAKHLLPAVFFVG